MFRNAYALMAATVLTSALGVGFWALAARLYDTGTVGRASAAIAAMMLMSNASQLNLSVGLMRFLPVSRGSERRLVSTAYAMSAGVGTLAAVAFLLVAPRVSHKVSFLADGRFATLFVVGVATWVVFALQDAALTGIRATMWVPAENLVFGLLKLLLLAVMAPALSDHGILTAWVVSMVIMLVPVNWLIFGRLLPRARRTVRDPGMPPVREMVRFVGGDYVGNLLSHASTTALPVLVIAVAGPEESAVFFMAWTIGLALDFIATGTASSFLVEGAGRQDQVDRYRRAATRRAALLLLPAVAATCLLADVLLSIFGTEYRDARWALVVLSLAAVPRMLLLLRLAYLRVERRIGTVVRLQALACTSMLGLSAVSLHLGGGSLSVALSWLFTEVLVLGVAGLTARHAPTPAAAAAYSPGLAEATPARRRIRG